MIHNIFSVPLYNTKLSIDNKPILSFCTSLAKRNKGRVLTNIGGWQSKDLVKNEKPLIPLYRNITYHANKFTQSLEFKGAVNLLNVWVNINGYKDFNALHKHDHSFISGVYYVKTPKDCGNIIFQRPGFDAFTSDWNRHQEKFNDCNTAVRWQAAEESILYLFPSWQNHYVEPNLNKKEKRISISFNFALTTI